MLNRLPSSISALLDARADGYSLPAGLYTREDVFNADMDVFFHKHWICVGLDCDVPEPGDAMVVDVGNTSLILLRDDDNEIRVAIVAPAFLMPARRSFRSSSVRTIHGPTS